MKTTTHFYLTREQMHNPVVQELFDRHRASWDKNSWDGKEYTHGNVYLTESEISAFNNLCRENHVEVDLIN